MSRPPASPSSCCWPASPAVATTPAPAPPLRPTRERRRLRSIARSAAADRVGRSAAERMARRVALALADPAFRAYVKGSLDRSPVREHKLHFQRLLRGQGGRALQALARAGRETEATVDADAAAATGARVLHAGAGAPRRLARGRAISSWPPPARTTKHRWPSTSRAGVESERRRPTGHAGARAGPGRDRLRAGDKPAAGSGAGGGAPPPPPGPPPPPPAGPVHDSGPISRRILKVG